MKQLMVLKCAVLIIGISFLSGCIRDTGSSQKNQGPELEGNRFFTLATVVRVNQIEVSRDETHGRDESSVHTPAEAKVFRETIARAWPGARITWAFSWLALS